MSTTIKLLPNYFKKVGLSLIIISIMSAVIIKLFHLDDLFNKKILGTIFLDLLIIFCCLIIFSRDKIEDEMTILIRLKQFAGTFAGIVAMSFTYIASGSLIFSPILKAVVGAVGVISQQLRTRVVR